MDVLEDRQLELAALVEPEVQEVPVSLWEEKNLNISSGRNFTHSNIVSYCTIFF